MNTNDQVGFDLAPQPRQSFRDTQSHWSRAEFCYEHFVRSNFIGPWVDQ